ncbi:hypothetical protein LXL04_003185 [Taraxacum kok-saghyz]
MDQDNVNVVPAIRTKTSRRCYVCRKFGNDYQGESCSSDHYASTGGRMYWMPNVSNEIRHFMWTQYPSYEHIQAMYYFCIVQAGFDVRKKTQKKFNGFVSFRYFVCNRKGEPNVSSQDTLKSNCRIKKRLDMHRGGVRRESSVELFEEHWSLRYMMSKKGIIFRSNVAMEFPTKLWPVAENMSNYGNRGAHFADLDRFWVGLGRVINIYTHLTPLSFGSLFTSEHVMTLFMI